jgi:glycosyltransferase involved in cell wall biosynthesis
MDARDPPPKDRAAGPRPLRIALVSETYPPEINGVAMTLGRLVAGMQARGHGIQLVRPRQGGEAGTAPAVPGIEEVLRPGLAIPLYRGLHVGLPARGLCNRLWRQRRPDLVHIATEGPLGWSALAAANALDLPVLAGFHTNFPGYSRHYGLGWLKRPIDAYLRGFHNRAQLTVVPTRALRDQLARQGYRNLAVLPRGVDADLFTPARRRADLRQAWGVGEDGLAVAYVGRLAPEKNLSLLLRCFGAIARARPDARLVLVGEGPDAAALRASHPALIHAGPRTGTDLAEHYASADLFLFPSLTETFGNVVLEAMASGLAVVCFDYAAAAEHVVHGVNGVKSRFGDEDDFIAQAAALARQPTTLARCGAAAHETARAVSWDKVFDCLEDHYRHLGRDNSPA